MQHVNVRELRQRFKYYLDLVEQGEELAIIRNSVVIAHITASTEIKALLEADELAKPSAPLTLIDGRQVTFRRFGMFEDPGPIRRIYEGALKAAGAFDTDKADYLDRDLDAPAHIYELDGGEFWIGEQDSTIIAMGAFRRALYEAEKTAELKRMRVEPDLQGQGIGSELLKQLEKRIKVSGYQMVVLDTVVDTPAEKFYQSHGYQKYDRPNSDFPTEVVFYRKDLNYFRHHDLNL